MSESILRRIETEIQSLSAENLLELRRLIDAKLEDSKRANNPKHIDRSKEMAWLAEHQDEYAGQWVALDGERLLAHGDKLKDVADAARELGVNDALLVRAESTKKLPYVGLWECHTK